MMFGKTVMVSQFFCHNCSKKFLWWESFQSNGVLKKGDLLPNFCRKNCCKKLLRWESLRGMVYWKIGSIEKSVTYPQFFYQNCAKAFLRWESFQSMVFLKNCDVLQIFRSELFQDTFKLRILTNKRNRKKRIVFPKVFLSEKFKKI